MKLTQQQLKIITSKGDIKINAVAGSGKTTTVIEYAKAKPQTSKILYLAFNRSVKEEAINRFLAEGLTNVTVETAHSLAYKYIVYQHNYKIRNQGYKTNEIAELLKLKGNNEKHTEYVIANHINKFIAYFLNSDKQKVQQLNYLDVVSDDTALKFVSTFYKYIENQTRILLAKMNSGEIEITHDFYLKKFQLANPQLNYDYILFDEGQDASPAMLDVFLNQKATKVIVGDTHQQIYGWRFAVNSLEKANFKTFDLSTSFRFGQNLASLANDILKFKKHIDNETETIIIGKGTSKSIKSKAILARTNLGLLLKAIESISGKKEINSIYFEGNINSYTYADEGASLYDVLNLSNDKRHLIKDKLIKEMKDLDELEEYIEKTEDMQLAMMVEIVREYGMKIPGLINKLKEKHIDTNEKHKAELIFSTVHRSKGMEYDCVELVNDFITEDKLERQKNDIRKENLDLAKLNEEINLLYVAVTRAKYKLVIPETLLPKNFPACENIEIIKVLTKEQKKELKANKDKSYTLESARLKSKAAYKPWTPELDKELINLYTDGLSGPEIALKMGRSKSAISSRLKKVAIEEGIDW